MDINKITIKKIAAFTIIYVVWGTTYLAIRFAIETIPPFLMAGFRFTLAGLLIFTWSYFRFSEKPTLSDWKKLVIPAILMFVLGNGLVTWTEQFIPSGLAALIIAMLPIWMVILNWLFFKCKQLDPITIIGIVIGLTGVIFLTSIGDAILINQSNHQGSIFAGIIILTFASISWATGSLYIKKIKTSVSMEFSIGMQVLMGGIVLIFIGLLHGEWTKVSITEISLISFFSLGYLIFLGTIIAYYAYIWLLHNSSPVKVGTFAFFNPLIAVFAGWIIVNEPLTLQMVLGMICILISILLVNRPKFQKKSLSFFHSIQYKIKNNRRKNHDC
jgi:drug/metabolite transporter (DMT)-like permease